MKILLISYDYFRYDGRVRELIKVAKDLGDVTYITVVTEMSSPRKSSISFTKTMDTWDFYPVLRPSGKETGKTGFDFH